MGTPRRAEATRRRRGCGTTLRLKISELLNRLPPIHQRIARAGYASYPLYPATPEDAPPTNAEQVAAALLELTNLQPWMAYQLAVVVPEELIPAHAVRLHESPTCQLTGAPFVEDAASPYAMVYVPEEDVLISRAANQVKGAMTVNTLIKFCRIVAKANPLTA